MRNKKVYVVRGSEDGNIGVFTNKKKAYQCAFGYASSFGEEEVFIRAGWKNYEKVKASYTNACKEISKYECGGVSIERGEEGGDYVCADIETFYLNG